MQPRECSLATVKLPNDCGAANDASVLSPYPPDNSSWTALPKATFTNGTYPIDRLILVLKSLADISLKAEPYTQAVNDTISRNLPFQLDDR